MRLSHLLLACSAALTTRASDVNISKPLISKQLLPSTFSPPQVFENINLVRNVDLVKGYPREVVNVVVKNIDDKPQNEYYIPFEAPMIARIGGLEVRDKNDASKAPFKVEVTEFDHESTTEYFLVHFSTPLAPKAEITLSIKYTVASALKPLPATIDQMAKQFLQYTTSAYATSAYRTLTQKTKIKFPNTNIPDYTVLPAASSEAKEDPVRQGTSFTYGPYKDVPAGTIQLISVRYEYTFPLIQVTRLERDVEVSHWGGNLATEERYWTTNAAAKIKGHFSRVSWQMTQYAQPPTTAVKELKVPLQIGSLNPYFTDDIGNVSTSRWRSSRREALLELKPRYPVFGGWNYSFRIGWDAPLAKFLRRVSGETFVLKVPFLEGPKMAEGVQYDRVDVRVILPEGAKNVAFSTSLPSTLLTTTTTTHKTFMDTTGRPTLHLTVLNLVDEARDTDLIVTYDYPWTAGFRKPLVFTGMAGALFFAVWVVGSLDLAIGGKKKAA